MFKARMMAYYLKILQNKKAFSRTELMDVLQMNGAEMGEASFKAALQNY